MRIIASKKEKKKRKGQPLCNFRMLDEYICCGAAKPSTAPLWPVKIGEGSRGVTPPATHVGTEGMNGGGVATQSGADEAPSGDGTGSARVAEPAGDVKAPGVDAQQAPSPRASPSAAELGARSEQATSPQASSSGMGAGYGTCGRSSRGGRHPTGAASFVGRPCTRVAYLVAPWRSRRHSRRRGRRSSDRITEEPYSSG